MSAARCPISRGPSPAFTRQAHLQTWPPPCLHLKLSDTRHHTYVCQEAHQVVSEQYALVFQTVDHGGIWFNFEIDTLYLDKESFSCYPEHADDVDFWYTIIDESELAGSPLDLPNLCQNIKHVAFVMREDDGIHESWALSMIDFFEHLQIFTFVLRHHRLDASDNTPLSLMEPTDVTSAFRQDHTYRAVPLRFKILESFRIDRLQELIKPGKSQNGLPDVPTFAEKVAMTEAMMENLER